MTERGDPREHTSLQSALARMTTLVALLAMLVAGALVILTTVLQHATDVIGTSVESVRLAEDAAIDLLLHARAQDRLVRGDLETDLRRKLDRAGQFVSSDEEARQLVTAGLRVDDYIAAVHDPRRSMEERSLRQEAAYDALQQLVEYNVVQSRTITREAARWNDLANGLGIAAGVLVVVLAGALLVWLKRRAFEPILDLASAMERFGRGDHDMRAREHGPRELREMSRRFNDMASAIAAQRRAQMAFLGGVAHDLRNPLSALKLSVSVLRLDESPSPARVQQTIERIDRQITRMERMLGDFLDMARIEAGQLELRVETHDVRRLVTEVVELFEATSRDHLLEVRLPEAEAPLRCDHLRIEQALTNLISNAIKYSPVGSTIVVTLVPGQGELELRVTDQGVGLTEEDKRRLFEPFQRAGQMQQIVPGAGLGLFVVRKIVEAHGGRIAVESTPGVGSTFRLLLPTASDA